MKRVQVDLPENCEQIGFLYEDDDKDSLGEDMLEVMLPSGMLIDAGWYPDGSETGSYMVTATLGLSDIVEPAYFSDAEDAARHVEKIAGQYVGRTDVGLRISLALKGIADSLEADAEIPYTRVWKCRACQAINRYRGQERLRAHDVERLVCIQCGEGRDG